MQIEVLAFEGCPNAEIASTHVAEALSAEGAQAEVAYIEVDTAELAEQHRFLGSPSVRVNGADVEPGAQARTDFGLMCRTYQEGSSTSGSPSVELIRSALRGQQKT